jgi:hypothetical protein
MAIQAGAVLDFSAERQPAEQGREQPGAKGGE